MSHHLNVPDNYGYVLLSVWALVLVYFFVPTIIVNGARKKAFPKEFMEKHFAEEHKKAIGGSAPSGGYPDIGSGRYSQKLSYDAWYHFNNAQRVHYNFLEQLPIIVINSLLSGIFYPIPAAIATATYAVGRIAYSIGYVVGGPGLRLPGGALSILPTFFLLASAGYGVINYTLKL